MTYFHTIDILHATRVLLVLLLPLCMNIIDILIDIHVIKLNYYLLQRFICVCEFDYITSMHFFLKRWLFEIQDINNEMEFFFVFLHVFFAVFNTTQNEYPTKNGCRIAPNTSLIVKPKGAILKIIIIDMIQALFARLISIQASTSVVFNMVLGTIHIKFKTIWG